MNGWDVLSDAIKIGLGGVIAYFTATQTIKSDARKAHAQRKHDSLEKMAAELADVHAHFTKLAGTGLGLGVMVADKRGLDEHSEKVLGNLKKYFEDCAIYITKMQSIRGRLLLLNMRSTADALRDYAGSLNEIQQTVSEIRPEHASIIKATEVLTEQFRKNEALYTGIFYALATEFCPAE